MTNLDIVNFGAKLPYQTDANPGTDYKDIYWQDGRRIVELKTLAGQLNACDGCDTPLNLMNIEQERVYGFGSYLSKSTSWEFAKSNQTLSIAEME
jgi:hypothetical protein